jgi:hypothetical protein
VVSDSDLARACADLGWWIALAETLLPEPDRQPSERAGGTPSSCPPWNSAVANALLDAHAGIRDLEAEMRLEVDANSGARALETAGRRRSDRSGNTGEVLAAIASKELAVTRQECDRAVRRMARLALAIRRLPAVDEALRWERIRPGPDGLPPVCPYCELYSLRVAVTAGLVACWTPGCTDDTGERPEARLDLSLLDARPVLVWRS